MHAGKLLFLILTIWLISGQRGHAQGFNGKIIAGINANQIEGDGLAGYNKPGLLVGVGAAFPMGGNWSLEPEAIYSQRGSRTSNSEFDRGLLRVEFRLNYIELPIMLNYTAQSRYIFQFGLSPNALISARYDDGVSDWVDYTDRFKRVDLCGAVGVEWRILDNLGFNVRLSRSLLAVNKIENKTGSYTLNPVTSTWLGAGMFNNTLTFSLRLALNNQSK